jgi:hypothetical protein
MTVKFGLVFSWVQPPPTAFFPTEHATLSRVLLPETGVAAEKTFS